MLEIFNWRFGCAGPAGAGPPDDAMKGGAASEDTEARLLPPSVAVVSPAPDGVTASSGRSTPDVPSTNPSSPLLSSSPLWCIASYSACNFISCCLMESWYTSMSCGEAGGCERYSHSAYGPRRWTRRRHPYTSVASSSSPIHAVLHELRGDAPLSPLTVLISELHVQPPRLPPTPLAAYPADVLHAELQRRVKMRLAPARAKF